ncbi:MAG: hypothetical protein Q9159_006976 [Coniocarpon cinnabarinum]
MEQVEQWSASELQDQYDLRVKHLLHPKRHGKSGTAARVSMEYLENAVKARRTDVTVQELRKRCVAKWDIERMKEEFDELMKRCLEPVRHMAQAKTAQESLEYFESLLEEQDKITIHDLQIEFEEKHPHLAGKNMYEGLPDSDVEPGPARFLQEPSPMSKAAKKKWIEEQKVANLQLEFDLLTMQAVYPWLHTRLLGQARRDLKDFERLVRKYRKDGTTYVG